MATLQSSTYAFKCLLLMTFVFKTLVIRLRRVQALKILVLRRHINETICDSIPSVLIYLILLSMLNLLYHYLYRKISIFWNKRKQQTKQILYDFWLLKLFGAQCFGLLAFCINMETMKKVACFPLRVRKRWFHFAVTHHLRKPNLPWLSFEEAFLVIKN